MKYRRKKGHKTPHPRKEFTFVGLFDNYKIGVFQDEHTIPHFHFLNRYSGQQGCFEILRPRYFKHSIYQNEMDSESREHLVEFLKSEPQSGSLKTLFRKGVTHYEVLSAFWDMNNDDNMLELIKGVPNYVELEEEEG